MAIRKKYKKLTKLLTFLEKDPHIQHAIIFGSYATGTQSKHSDIDLALQLRNPMTAAQKLVYLEKLQNCTDAEIDLVDLLKVGQPLLSQIMKYGERLKGSVTQHAELAIKNINTTQDFMPLIERMMKERKERLLNG